MRRRYRLKMKKYMEQVREYGREMEKENIDQVEKLRKEEYGKNDKKNKRKMRIQVVKRSRGQGERKI